MLLVMSPQQHENAWWCIPSRQFLTCLGSQLNHGRGWWCHRLEMGLSGFCSTLVLHHEVHATVPFFWISLSGTKLSLLILPMPQPLGWGQCWHLLLWHHLGGDTAPT